MFWRSEKKSFSKWVSLAVVYMAEHDRVYHNLLVFKLTSIEPDSSIKESKIDTQSTNYLCGKYLFRTFALSFVIAGASLEKKLSESRFDELQDLVKMITLIGTNGEFSHLAKELSVTLDEIPIEALTPLHGRGAGFMDESWQAFMRHFAAPKNDIYQLELVKLYCEALRFCIKDLNDSKSILSMMPQAMSMFSGARKAIAERI